MILTSPEMLLQDFVIKPKCCLADTKVNFQIWQATIVEKILETKFNMKEIPSLLHGLDMSLWLQLIYGGEMRFLLQLWYCVFFPTACFPFTTGWHWWRCYCKAWPFCETVVCSCGRVHINIWRSTTIPYIGQRQGPFSMDNRYSVESAPSIWVLKKKCTKQVFRIRIGNVLFVFVQRIFLNLTRDQGTLPIQYIYRMEYDFQK